MNNRRKLVGALGAGMFTVPLTPFAQLQGKVWRVGFLSPRGRVDSIDSDYYGGFTKGLRELGYVEGKNLTIEWRFADGRLDRLPELATELVRQKVDVIVAPGMAATGAAQKATTTLPIVAVNPSDPVRLGYVATLARPGGNITGLRNFLDDFPVKHLEMLLDMVPKLSRVAVLMHPVAAR
jgi:putative ABC transport system substrate-binding protein